MSSAPPRQSAHNSTSSAFRVNYLDYVAELVSNSIILLIIPHQNL